MLLILVFLGKNKSSQIETKTGFTSNPLPFYLGNTSLFHTNIT